MSYLHERQLYRIAGSYNEWKAQRKRRRLMDKHLNDQRALSAILGVLITKLEEIVRLHSVDSSSAKEIPAVSECPRVGEGSPSMMSIGTPALQILEESAESESEVAAKLTMEVEKLTSDASQLKTQIIRQNKILIRLQKLSERYRRNRKQAKMISRIRRLLDRDERRTRPTMRVREPVPDLQHKEVT